MSEKERDPEGLEPALRDLFEAARVDPVLDARAIERVVARAEGLTRTPAPAVKGSGGTFIAAGVVIVMLVSLGVWVARERRSNGSMTPSSSEEGSGVEVQSESVPDHGEEVEVEEPSPPAFELEVVGTDEPAQPRRRAARRAGARQEADAQQEDAPSEGELLLRARAALARNADLCLSLTAEHRRLYPSGSMREERDVLAVEALARLGRMEEARARAAAFERTYRSSPYMERIHRVVR